MMDEIDLCVQVEKIKIGAFDTLLLLLLHLEQVALHKLAVVARLYRIAHHRPLLLVTTQLLLYLHLYLLEYLQLTLVGRRLLAPLASHVDVVGHSLIRNGACVAEEGPTVGQMGGTGCD
jgi:hypothetical protein